MFSKVVINQDRPRENVCDHTHVGHERNWCFWLHGVPEGRIQSRAVLWAGSKAGTTLRFADV